MLAEHPIRQLFQIRCKLPKKRAEKVYSAATVLSAFSTRTAENLNSGIFP